MVAVSKLWIVAVFLTLTGCSGWTPYRSATTEDIAKAAQSPACADLYKKTDGDILPYAMDPTKTFDQREAFLQTEGDLINPNSPDQENCWRTAHEHHDTYDLLYAEFDDSGWATDVAYRNVAFGQSQIYHIETFLTDFIADKNNSYYGLNLVIFAHGWHGNASANDAYSILFRGMLQDINARESYASKQLAQRGLEEKKRRVVGIEIAWRGDSFLHPGIPFVDGSKNALNIWDRKGASEVVATGAVQQLFAFLHEFYLENSCHGHFKPVPGEKKGCDQVHMLTLGHSLGALIDFRALAPRLESGLNAGRCHYTYGFGDLTVLLNPAFEAARYEGVFNNAVNRPSLMGPYPGPGDTECATDQEQLPALVIIQSMGDSATHYFFPLMRWLGTRQRTLSHEEEIEKNSAVGWVDLFRTHELHLGDKAYDDCDYPSGNLRIHCPFSKGGPRVVTGLAAERPPQFLRLSWNWGASNIDPPSYMPLWDIAVDPTIMVEHNDFWNPQVVKLIKDMYEDAYNQADRLGCRDEKKRSGQECDAIGNYGNAN